MKILKTMEGEGSVAGWQFKITDGKNAILKGVNYDPAATGRERNLQIGGHKSNG